jgi:stringent starvation protein B
MKTRDSNRAKRELCEHLLDRGTVMLVLDARRDGVRVPDHLAEDPGLRLNIDYRYGARMEVSDDATEATLSFAGEEFDCRLPWESIYVMLSHDSNHPHVFPDDVPRELLDEIGIEPGQDTPMLHVVPGGGAELQGSDPADVPEGPPDSERQSVRRRDHLRVVK